MPKFPLSLNETLPRGTAVFKSCRFDDKRGEHIFELSFPYTEDGNLIGKEIFSGSGVTTLRALADLIEADGLQNNGG